MSTIKLKRSAVEGRVPGAEDLELGELAINTFDGRLYLKKSASGANSIVDVSSGLTATEISTLLQTVDGVGSGLDADLLDGEEGSYYTNATNISTGTLDSARLPDLAVSDFAGAAVQTSGESFSDSDTVFMTSAAIADKIESYGYITSETDSQTLTWTGANTTLSISGGNDVNLSSLLDDTNTTYDLVSPGVGVLRLSDSANANDDITFSGSGATSVSSNTTHIIVSSTDTTYANGAGLGLSGTTFSHLDTSSVSNVTASGRTYVTGLTFDGFGHVTGVSTGTETVVDTDTTYDLVSPGSGVLRLSDSANANDNITFVGSGATSVSSNATHIIVSSTDTTYSSGNNVVIDGTVISTSPTPTFSYADFTPTDPGPAHSEGRFFYHDEYKTFTMYSDISDVSLQMGLEEWVRVYNATGSTILNGTPCRPAGVFGETQSVAPANATSQGLSRVLGVATHDIPDATYGFLTVRGLVSGLNTSGLTAGQPIFLAADGSLTNTSPTYPFYPTQIGGCIVSDATAGYIYVSPSYNTISQLRITGNQHIDGDLTIDGDFTVTGTQSVVSQNNLNVSNSFIYLNTGDAIGEDGTTFTGTGLDDAYFTHYFTGPVTKTFYVRIDGVGTGTGGVDTFEWSTDNFATTEATGVDITGSRQDLEDGIEILFNATTGHTSGDTWSGTASPVAIDTGWGSNRNTGASGVGYTHMGIFFDVSDNKFKAFDEYGPDPQGTIDTDDVSFNLGTFVANSFEGDLTGNVIGNVTGNAATATSALSANNATNLNGQAASYYLDYTNATNKPTIGNATITITAGSGLTTGGNFTTNQTSNETITINHADTSSQASLTALTGAAVVSDIDIDGFGHVTNLSTRNLTLANLGYTGATNADNYGGWDLFTDGTNRGAISSGENVNFVGGTNVSLSYSATNNTITINSTDTNTNNYVTGLSFNTGDGILTASRSGLSNLTVDLDGRYLTSYTESDTLDSVTDRGATTTNELTVGGLSFGSTVKLDAEELTTTSSTQETLAQFATATFSGGKFIINAKQGTSVHMTELMVVHNGTTASATEYGTIMTDSSLFSVDVDISSGNFRIRITPTSSTSTTFNVSENLFYA